jgi:hypothetical protein
MNVFFLKKEPSIFFATYWNFSLKSEDLENNAQNLTIWGHFSNEKSLV